MAVHAGKLEHALACELRAGALLLRSLAAKRTEAPDKITAHAVWAGLPMGVGVVWDGSHHASRAREDTTDSSWSEALAAWRAKRSVEFMRSRSAQPSSAPSLTAITVRDFAMT